MKANCISCQEMVNAGNNPLLGKIITCPKCDARLEVVWLEPLELDWPTDEYDDDDDYSDEDY
ncbi:MAG: lysine biosynthesis protein LysW [Anaerolineae bacterium]|uniref:Lysine biosynthesis protein LysW n=1 Tax=Candidatus Desulfolinea nitratireducens TaxID=2841698 RepID=A0A8J6NGZ5_9CHLR|nr:lysine biosynthesis protein LysW [Candidatus Desulfolinea nitratireducens]MBL6960298.1 lysine biosynthesis protein LysW [Anaerolineales bacterium]NQU29795.1 lysine biosynthesis protein LysW [Anaerolineae bacterium]